MSAMTLTEIAHELQFSDRPHTTHAVMVLCEHVETADANIAHLTRALAAAEKLAEIHNQMIDELAARVAELERKLQEQDGGK